MGCTRPPPLATWAITDEILRPWPLPLPTLTLRHQQTTAREQLLALWETYSAGLPSASLELRVAQRALRDGCSAKEVALMLVAGSEVVKLIHDKQGRKEAIAFALHMVTLASQQQTQTKQGFSHGRSLQIELGD